MLREAVARRAAAGPGLRRDPAPEARRARVPSAGAWRRRPRAAGRPAAATGPRAMKTLLLALIRGYQYLLRPMLGVELPLLRRAVRTTRSRRSSRHGALQGLVARAAPDRALPPVSSRRLRPGSLNSLRPLCARRRPAQRRPLQAVMDTQRLILFVDLLVLGAVPVGGVAARAPAAAARRQRAAAGGEDAGRPPGAAGGDPARGRSGDRRRARGSRRCAGGRGRRGGRARSRSPPTSSARTSTPRAASITRGRARCSTATRPTRRSRISRCQKNAGAHARRAGGPARRGHAQPPHRLPGAAGPARARPRHRHARAQAAGDRAQRRQGRADADVPPRQLRDRRRLRHHQRRHRADRAVRLFPVHARHQDAGLAELDGAGRPTPARSSTTRPTSSRRSSSASIDKLAADPARKLPYTKNADNGWVGMVEHYFVTAWLPSDEQKVAARVLRAQARRRPLRRRRDRAGRRRSRPARPGDVDVPLYVGPQDQDAARASSPRASTSSSTTASSRSSPRRSSGCSSGCTASSATGAGRSSRMTIIIKSAFYPLNHASARSMAKMKVIAPEAEGAAGAVRERQAAAAGQDDGDVQAGEDQPARRLPADPGADPGVHRALLGAAVGGRAAPRAVDRLDPRPVGAGPVLRAAGDLRDHRVPAGEAVADADLRSGAGEGDADHADRVLGDVRLLPVGPRALLARQQLHPDLPAVAHEPRAGEGSRARRRPSGARQALDAAGAVRSRDGTRDDAAADTIAAIATPPGRGGIGVVRVSGPAVPAAHRRRSPAGRSRRAWRRSRRSATARGEPLDQGLALHFPGAALLHRRARARAARPRRPGGAAAAARALRRARRAARRARRVHAARVPQRQARPRAGRERGRPDRRGDDDRGARRGAQPVGRVLARDPRAGRRADRAADVHRGDARLSRRGHRVPARRPTRAGGSRRSRAALASVARRGRGRARCCATGSPSCSSAGPTSASRACSTGWPATRSRSSRRSPARRATPSRAQIEIARHPADDRRHRRPARRPTTRSRRSASSAPGRRSRAPISRWCSSTRAQRRRHHGRAIAAILARLPAALPRIVVHNKIDLAGHRRARSRRRPPGAAGRSARAHVWLSREDRRRASTCCGGRCSPPPARTSDMEGTFLARERHLAALRDAAGHLAAAAGHLAAARAAAGALRRGAARGAGGAVGITGEFTADDLLGAIFSRFCIGK